MGFENLLYQEISQSLGVRYFSMQSNETHPSWVVYDWTYPSCKSVDCPQLGDFNYMQCLLGMDVQDLTCRKVLRQQRIKVRVLCKGTVSSSSWSHVCFAAQVNIVKLMGVLEEAGDVSYVPHCRWRLRGYHMIVECN